uniref:Uncharacterized protein n=1 Tax=Anopheles albimanus TaxID=7167 RepID=A0A182FXC9_ANOAL
MRLVLADGSPRFLLVTIQ